MELWYSEKQTKDLGITCKVRETLHVERTRFQHLAVLDTYEFGRMLVLDGAIQTTIRDEFIYHEMIVHVPLFTHGNPRRVAIIGGGDGGTVREVLKHPSVEEVVLVEIDGKVIEASKRFLPEISCGLEDERVTVIIGDGIKHIKENKGQYDVVLVDSTDPVGPATGLFSQEFYKNVYEALGEDGLFVAQTESPFFNGEFVAQIFTSVSNVFPICRLYLTDIPTYPSGFWSFTMGSKKYDPLQVNTEEIPEISCKYYTPDLHKSAFTLPRFVKELVQKNE